MAIKKEAYLYLSAALRAREAKLLSGDRAERMLDAPGFEECAKLLTDCDYGDMSQMNAKEIDAELSQRRAGIFAEMDRMAPDRRIVDVFRMKYDYHNAKAVVKAMAVGADAGHILSACGRVTPEKLLAAYNDERWNELPPVMAAAVEEARDTLAHTSNPQLADFVLDRAYFTELLAAARALESGFLTGYARLLIDSTNLRSFVRTARMGKDAEFLREALIPGGSVDTGRFLVTDREGLAALFTHTELENAAVLGAEAAEGGALTQFELACDNAVNAYISRAKLVSFGEEPLVAYLSAVESEMTAIRMILTGRLAGIEPGVIRERLRDMYA